MFSFVLMTKELLKHGFGFPLRPASFDHQFKLQRHVSIAVRFDFFEMFRLEALVEMLPLRSIFQNMTFIHCVQRLANVTKIAKFNLPSI